MPLSTISRTARQFYLNYHYTESSPLWIHSAFTRRIQFAFRMVISFLIGGFLAYGTPLQDQLSQEYMIPNICILCIQETFGMTVSNSVQMIFVIVPLSIFLFVIQKIGLSYQEYLAGELLLLISTFFIAYKCTKIPTRKMSLLFNVIFFATIINQPVVPLTFIFELLEEFVIGIAVALLVSGLVFPLFATFDIESRVNYCLTNLQQMHTLIIHAFLCQDQMGAQVSLARASNVEQMVCKTMNLIQIRRDEASFEPSRCFQRIFHRQRRQIIDLTLKEQEDFVNSLMYHVCSLQRMVIQCQFNVYHTSCIDGLQSNLLGLIACQSIVIESLVSSAVITKDEFTRRLTDLHHALESLRSAYVQTRLHRIESVLETGTKIQSEDDLSHAFFLFQLSVIVRLLTEATAIDRKKFTSEQKPKTKKSLKEWLKPDWPRFLSAIKSMIIIGVGSIFVMEPHLAKTFENGQWVLIALCMSQGDTVGGAFTTMKLRLIGTLLGAMWAYVTYLSVRDNPYQTLGMLVPWIFVFGYLKLLPEWGYTALVAISTPIVINLGRLPYGDQLPGGDYALLRIEENLVGIAIGIILTLVIVPIFAIDLLKVNIQATLKVCQERIESMLIVYDRFFHHQHSNGIPIKIEIEEEKIDFLSNPQQSRFIQLINDQRTLVDNAALEPSLWCFNNNFSSVRYKTLVEQQIDMVRMFHNINAALIRILECSTANEEQTNDLRIRAAGGLFLPDLHEQLVDLSQLLSDCLNLWSSYFASTQTQCHRFVQGSLQHRKYLHAGDLAKHERCLIELHRTVLKFQDQHQQGIDHVLKHYLARFAAGETSATSVPYASSDQADSLLVAMSALYYSITQLARAALALGTTVHTIFELESTHRYRHF